MPQAMLLLTLTTGWLHIRFSVCPALGLGTPHSHWGSRHADDA